MVQSKKSSAKKQSSRKSGAKKPKGGVDFKKYKHKVGRKLPPPKNATNTQINSKAIILPEQSMASDRTGLAVNKKGLTLRELLQQTSHHNAKIRRTALAGVRDLVMKHPSELNLHKLAIIEKLRERICDNDKVVRETLYQILKTVIFRRLKEDITWPIISLMMAYIFNAMTHIAVDIRLMAFKFFELVVLSYPSSFMLYADKVLDNYIDILRNNQIYLQDKSKLKSALGGLLHCLSLLACKKGEADSLYQKNGVEQRCLHTFKSEDPKANTGVSSVIKKFEDLVPLLVNFFQESISLFRPLPVIDVPSFDCMLCTLQCINLAVKIVINDINMPENFSGPSLMTTPNGPDVMRSTMLVLLKKIWETFPIGEMDDSSTKEDDQCFIMNVRIAEIFLHLSDYINDNLFLFEKFLVFIECILLGQLGSNLSSNKMLMQKHLSSIIPFIPRLVAQLRGSWKIRLLEAFTVAFKDCKVDSKMSLLYLSAIEEMLLPIWSAMSRMDGYHDMLGHQIAWLQELPKILLQLGDKHSDLSKVVLKLLLQFGQSSSPNSPFALEYDYLQEPLREFFCSKTITDKMHYGPFMKLPNDCQEIAICCLYYFSNLRADMLESLARCCLCDDLEPNILLRIVEVLHSAYKAGRVQISDQIGFLVTLVARFRVYPEKYSTGENEVGLSNRGTFKSLTNAACTCLHQMGDTSLVLKLLYRSMFYGISVKLPLDNLHGLLKLTVTLGTEHTIFSEDCINNLSNWISGYLTDAAASYIPESVDPLIHSDQTRIFQYYVQPCIFLFYRNEKLLCCVLKLLESLIKVDESSFPSADVKYVLDLLSRVRTVASILSVILNDVKLYGSLSSTVASINNILQSMNNILASNDLNMTLEERYKLHNMFDQLKARASKLQVVDASNIGEL